MPSMYMGRPPPYHRDMPPPYHENTDVEMTSPPGYVNTAQHEAVHKVFGTTELVEMILFWLPLPSLLRVQAVNTHWRDLIQDSLRLRQQLFLQSENADKIWLVEVANLPAQQRPLPRNFKSSLNVLAEVPTYSEALKTHHGLIVTPVRFNPLFFDSDPYLEGPEDMDRKVDRCFVAEYTALNELLSTVNNHSMRNMFLTQPPATNVHVEVLVKRRPREEVPVVVRVLGSSTWSIYGAKLIDQNGVRLHQVAEALEKTGMLARAESIKVFMCGVVVPSEQDMKEVRRRTEEWSRAELLA